MRVSTISVTWETHASMQVEIWNSSNWVTVENGMCLLQPDNDDIPDLIISSKCLK